MAIPDFQSIMRPLLEHMADGMVKNNRQTIDALGRHFQLTDEELNQLLPSGQQSVFTNRIAWAKAHLKKAELLESPNRGQYKITRRGLDAVGQNDQIINLKYLRQFEAYRVASNGADLPKANEEQKSSDSFTPSEYIEMGYQRLREQLEEELLLKIKELSPAFFERLVVELLVAMGYGGSRKDAGQTIG